LIAGGITLELRFRPFIVGALIVVAGFVGGFCLVVHQRARNRRLEDAAETGQAQALPLDTRGDPPNGHRADQSRPDGRAQRGGPHPSARRRDHRRNRG
ncbi:MAG: hypothetical protein JWO63_132, partial [Frankiales bacterium]|nr:hypothetical protein [Frankiales bacterium]